MTRAKFLLLSLAIVVMPLALPLTQSVPASAQELAPQKEFRISCAACHGLEGKGDGLLAGLLTLAPTDLTQITKRNNGKFPLVGLYETIDGRREEQAHGARDMPIWGERYRVEACEEDPLYQFHISGCEALIRGRTLELIYYIQSIQEE
jgi:hypothetical protein